MTTDAACKRYTVRAQHGVKGEAFFESLVADYSLPHRVTGPKDLGIDFICEWTFGEKPSGVLYAVQVKTLRSNRVSGRSKAKESDKNHLMEYTLRNDRLKVDKRTQEYWNGMGIPAYLFLVTLDSQDSPTECYYKRYTHYLTERKEMRKEDPFLEFYKVNEGNRFLAFSDDAKREGGFARDLYVDYTRCQYSSGHLSPRRLGLNEFPGNAVFLDLAKLYEENIRATLAKMKFIVSQLGKDDF